MSTPSSTPPDSTDSQGSVFIMADRPRRFRVGTSRNPEKRRAMCLASNIDIKLSAHYLVANRMTCVKKCHQELRKYNIAGHSEWFEGLDLPLLKSIVETTLGADILNSY
jgi:hypothetical protein